jgi:hypothetical protein
MTYVTTEQVHAQQPTLSNYIPQDFQKDSFNRERENLEELGIC